MDKEKGKGQLFRTSEKNKQRPGGTKDPKELGHQSSFDLIESIKWLATGPPSEAYPLGESRSLSYKVNIKILTKVFQGVRPASRRVHKAIQGPYAVLQLSIRKSAVSHS